MRPGERHEIVGESRVLLEAVANRLVPADEWPSATEGGAIGYLERRAAEDPAAWEGRLEPGLRALDEAAARLRGRPFAGLPAEEQDELLREAESGRLRGWTGPAAAEAFFGELLELVVEGYYGSPEAGGNPEGKSWRMIGFRPGIVAGGRVEGRDGGDAGNDVVGADGRDVMDREADADRGYSRDGGEGGVAGASGDSGGGEDGEDGGQTSTWGPAGSRQAPPAEFELPLRAWEELRDVYDAVVVGAGAGGSVAAAVLAEAGLSVLVVERGRRLRYEEIGRDHVRNHRFSKHGHNTGPELTGNPRTIVLADGKERVVRPHEGDYHNNAMTVGGGTRVYGAQAWRFHPDDFRMASRYGVPDGSSLSDWPIGYAELAPYYERAEWEVGVSGDGVAYGEAYGRRGPSYPMPPLPRTLEAERLAEGAAKLGWAAGAVPLLINSIERDGRPACGRCGQCVGFACPTDSKNGGHNTMMRRAAATGRCDIVCETIAERVLTEGGRHATGVALAQEQDGAVRRREVRAGHVVVAAGAIESARLLLHSASDAEPDGIGNRSGHVGRHLQGHVYAGAYGLFDDPVQDGLGPGVSIATLRFAHGNDGVVGGGLLANEFTRLPILHWHRALAPDAPRWGSEGKRTMRESYLRTSQIQGPIQEIPTPESRVRLSPTVKDRYGLPVAMLSGSVHAESLRASAYVAERAEQWLRASGARQVWRTRAGAGLSGGQHQAGTLRMGDDPATSVTDPTGRVHGYDNLWVSDGSVHVTNGGVNPVLTILALAFRTAENLVKQG